MSDVEDNAPAKPKLVFFQNRYGQNMPDFVLLTRKQQVRCLTEFFDVVVIHDDCDYQEVCDTYQPSAALFEMLSGADLLPVHRPRVANVLGMPKIPRLAFLNADAWSEARSGFISDVEHLGIDAVFSICTTAAEHVTGLTDRLFVWPNFIDTELYRDYGLPKIIPVLLSGAQDSNYPWRRRVSKLVSEHYPSLGCPHRGYTSRSSAFQMLTGEAYARTINASWFFPTCGTVAKEIIRKHLEGPACNACLVTEKSPALEAAGFADMTNVVFAEPGEVLDKLHYLFENLSELQAITRAGYEMVRSRHGIRQRDQILQWVKLNQALRPGEKIIQVGPFQPLAVVHKSSGIGSTHLRADGIHLALLREGDHKLRQRRYEEAERLYLRCLNYIPWMPEPKIRLAICSLHKGDAQRALASLSTQLAYILNEYGAPDPDPVEWAYLIIAHLCQGRVGEASRLAKRFPQLRHPELDNARWAAVSVANGAPLLYERGEEEESKGSSFRHSIHQLQVQTIEEWGRSIVSMLSACRQARLAGVLEGCLTQAGSGVSRATEAVRSPIEVRENSAIRANSEERVTPAFNGTPRGTRARFGSRVLARLKGTLRAHVTSALHSLERRYGYFLPYRLSEMRNDEFLTMVRRVAATEDIRGGLLVGAQCGQGSTEAFLAGLMENPRKPVALCVSDSRRHSIERHRLCAEGSLVRWLSIPTYSQQVFRDRVEVEIAAFRDANPENPIDVLLINASGLDCELHMDGELRGALHSAKFVFFDDINSLRVLDSQNALLRDASYRLSLQNPCVRNGYAVFTRVPGQADPPGVSQGMY